MLGLNLGEQIYCVTSGVPPTVSTSWAATQITPEFEELNAALWQYLNAVTLRVIREEVHRDAGEAAELKQPLRL